MRRIECEKTFRRKSTKCSLCCQLITTLRSVVVLIVEDAATSERRWSELWARVQSLRALCNERVIGDDSVASSQNRHVIKPSPTDRLIGRSAAAAAAAELCLMIGRIDVGRPHWLAHQWLSDYQSSPLIDQLPRFYPISRHFENLYFTSMIYPIAKQTENNNLTSLTININSQDIQRDEVGNTWSYAEQNNLYSYRGY